MTTDPRAETIGLTLLGLALLVLTLSLRGAQPGLALSPPYLLLAAAAVAYLAASLLLTQSPLHAALAFSLMLAAHVLYATLMGAAFSLNEQAQPTGHPFPLSIAISGLLSYPPAIPVQAAFVIPLVGAIVRTAAPAPTALDLNALDHADSPRELLCALVELRRRLGVGTDATLDALASRAEVLLHPPETPTVPVTLTPDAPCAEPQTAPSTQVVLSPPNAPRGVDALAAHTDATPVSDGEPGAGIEEG